MEIGDLPHQRKSQSRAAALANRLTCPVTAGSLHKGVYLCLR